MKYTLAILIAAIFFGLTTQSVNASEAVDASKLFNKRCKMCHSINKKKAGPAVKHMNSDPAILKSALTTDRVKMMQAVIKKLNEAQVDALVTFIQSKHESGSLQAGAGDSVTTETVAPLCQGCHGSQGEGLEAASGMPAFPRLAGQIRGYLVQTLNDYKSGGRNSPMMAAIAKGLSDDDIAKIATYYADLD